MTLREERSARWPAWVLAAWAALCLFRLFQIARSYFYLRAVKRRAIASQEVLPPIARPARLLLSTDIASPMAVGFLHPAVILPESLPDELAQPEMEHVLLHEAAHIARRDDWTNLLARLLGAALALHPVAWWILRQIEREREIACDDWVVARTGSARPYAQSLARMSELRMAKSANEGEALASGIFGGGSRLGERIELLLARGRDFSPRVSMGRVAVSVAALLGCVIAGALAPRLIAFAQERLAFEVASVKLHPPGQRGFPPISISGSRVTDANSSVFDLVAVAYNLKRYQIAGGPSWIGSATAMGAAYDVTAKAPGDTVTMDQVRLMLQTLLAERFHLVVHLEAKEMPVYALVTGKGGPKLKVSPADGMPPGTRVAGGGDTRIQMTASKGTMDQLAFLLTNDQSLGRPVVDKTSLTGTYDYKLEYSNAAQDSDAPSIFTALQEQLGLRLESQSATIEILVIDHVEKPDEN